METCRNHIDASAIFSLLSQLAVVTHRLDNVLCLNNSNLTFQEFSYLNSQFDPKFI